MENLQSRSLWSLDLGLCVGRIRPNALRPHVSLWALIANWKFWLPNHDSLKWFFFVFKFILHFPVKKAFSTGNGGLNYSPALNGFTECRKPKRIWKNRAFFEKTEVVQTSTVFLKHSNVWNSGAQRRPAIITATSRQFKQEASPIFVYAFVFGVLLRMQICRTQLKLTGEIAPAKKWSVCMSRYYLPAIWDSSKETLVKILGKS